MAKKKRFVVRVYNEDGTEAGITTLDSDYDNVDCHPVETIKLAHEYANRFLITGGQYAVITK